MGTRNIITLRHGLLSEWLEECRASCDMTVICRDGRLRCNSLLLHATFRGIDDIFNIVEDNTVLIIPDVDTQHLLDFFENVFNQNRLIETHPSIAFLLNKKGDYKSVEINTEAESFEKFSIKDKTEQDFSDDGDLAEIGTSEGESQEETANVEIPVRISVKKKENIVKDETRRKYVRVKGRETLIHPVLKFQYKEFYCQVCDLNLGGSSKVIDNEKRLFSHVYFNHGPFPERKCPDCEQYLYSPKSLDKHRRQEHVEKVPCPECGKLICPYVMRQHMLNYHEKWQCEQCFQEFTTKYHLSKHILAVHKKASIPRQSWRMEERFNKECKCGIDFPTLKAKLSHFKLVHLSYTVCPTCKELIKKVNDPHVCNPERHKEYRRKNSQKEQVCKECGILFESVHKLVYHRENVHKAIECSCELCGKVFSNKYKLAAHLKKVNHSGKTPCPMCGVQVLNIKRHMKTAHSG